MEQYYDNLYTGMEYFPRTVLSKLNEPDFSAGRVIREDKHQYRILTAHGVLSAQCSGKMLHTALDRRDLPSLGDWVVYDPLNEGDTGIIHAVLPRKNELIRKEAGRTSDPQLIGSNIDILFILFPSTSDALLRAVPRYVSAACECRIKPVVLVTKTDLSEIVRLRELEDALSCNAVPVHCISAYKNEGIDIVTSYLCAGITAAFVGPSGAGKSTLISALTGDSSLRTGEVREADGKGRHTTTHREIVMTSDGAALMDHPGMRELGLWTDQSTEIDGFDDIDELADLCRFNDCSHSGEPGCAVEDAIRSGALPAVRLQQYMALQKELRYIESRTDPRLKEEEKNRMKNLSKLQKRMAESNKKYSR